MLLLVLKGSVVWTLVTRTQTYFEVRRLREQGMDITHLEAVEVGPGQIRIRAVLLLHVHRRHGNYML